MISEWLYGLSIIISIGSFLFLRYYPFREKLRISRLSLILVHCPFLILEIVVYLHLYRADGMLFYMHEYLLHDAFIFFYVAFSLFIIRVDIYRQLYLCFPLVLYELELLGIGMWMEYLLSAHLNLPAFLVLDITTGSLLLLTFPFVLRFFHYIEPLFEKKYTDEWKWGWVPSASFCFLEILHVFFPGQSMGIMAISRIVSFLAATGYLLFQLWFLDIQRKRMIFQQNLRLSQELAKLQAERMEIDTPLDRKVQAFTEELDVFLNRLEEAVQGKDTDAVRRLLSEGEKEVHQRFPERYFCRQEILDTIFCSVQEKAERYGIQSEIQVCLTEKFPMKDLDLCILFENLMGNALEACIPLPEDKRWIRTRVESEKERASIFIENSCDASSIHRDGDVFYSAKRGYDAPGTGLSSICDIVEKYHGTVNFFTDHDVFYVSISFGRNWGNLKKPEENRKNQDIFG